MTTQKNTRLPGTFFSRKNDDLLLQESDLYIDEKVI